MGGAVELPQRSSSPLKRRASDLEPELSASHEEDVEMEALPSPDHHNTIPETECNERETTQSSKLDTSLEILKDVDGDRNQMIDERNIPNEININMSGSPPNEAPSIDDQIKTVMQIIENHSKQPLKENERVFVISNKWLSRVQARGSSAKVHNKEDLEGEIGPIDNSDIIQEILQNGDGEYFVRLKHDIPRSSFEYFPEGAWQFVEKLYGLKQGQLPISRMTVNTNPDRNGQPNIEYELHPLVFIVHRLWAANSPIPLSQLMKSTRPKAPIFFVSRSHLFVEFLKRIKRATYIDVLKKVRVWKVQRTLGAIPFRAATIANETSSPPRGNTPVPESQPQPQDTWRELLVEVETFLKLEKGVQRDLVETKDHSANLNYNGHLTVQMADLGQDQALVLDEWVDHDFLSQYTLKISNNIPVTVSRSGVTQRPLANSGRSSPAPSGPITRGRAQRSGRTLGTVGLNNLGNTCYMNSALQCVRSVEELTKYFLTHQSEKEINRENPLGNNGDIALAYGSLLEELYRDPPPNTIVPRYFKSTIGKYAPSFSGYGQQDSQEFLGFLLDGLQEDLSRIKKKPYIAKPDSTDEMVGNQEAIREMAAKVWDITKKRDDSVIADLFTGMYKSTLVCPVCDKVSITFDPFNNLTLQLPIENEWCRPVFYFPLNDRPIQICIDLDKQSSIKALKAFVSSKVDVPVERLFVAEEFKWRFYKFYDDMKPVSEEIQDSDSVAVYELEVAPTNWPPPRKPVKQKPKSMLNFSHFDSDEDEVPNWDDPMAERMLVPVLHRQPSNDSSRYRKPWVHVPVPHFIIVTAEEARNEDAIRRKVLEKIATLTTHSVFNQDDESDEDGSSDYIDPDLVVTTSSDADSSGDSKVMATSIDGEDELVDVTTKNDSKSLHDPTELPNTQASKLSHGQELKNRKRRFLSRRPKWVNPKEYLEPGLQNLFDLKYFTGTKELVPAGWGSVDVDKDYPLLSSRNPQIPEAQMDNQEEDEFSTLNGHNQATSEVDSSDVEEDDVSQLAQTRMNDESSDDEPALNSSITRALPVRPGNQRPGTGVGYSRRRNRGIRTYSRKGMKLTAQIQQHDGAADDATDDGPLIRLGEGIVVDWALGAHEAMFNGDEHDKSGGRPTYTETKTMDDPVLDAKKKTRQNRKKRGLTLEECLDEFGKEEILSEMDTWYCPRCKEHRRASKKFELWKTPDILVMHLKRFSSNAIRRDKLDVMVDFPIEGLDLTSRVVEREDDKQEVYDLFAVDDHWGGLGGGHYTAFAKNFIDNEWYEYNDSSVSKQKDTFRIVSPGAYLLFYRRRSDIPLGGPRFKDIIDRFSNPPEPSEDGSADSGEDQRLVADSSLHGSSSALIGVGATHLPVGGGGVTMTRTTNHLASGGVASPTQSTINPADLDKPPAYREQLEDDDGAPLLARDAVMNDGLEVNGGIEDEGIDMTSNEGYNFNSRIPGTNLLDPSWSFDHIGTVSSTMMNTSGNNSDIGLGDMDDRSDAVQHNSSASAGSREGRFRDFENADVDPEEWEEPTPVPDLPEQDQMDIYNLHDEHLARRAGMGYDAMEMVKELKIPAGGATDEESEEEAAEIHVEEGEGLKMD